MRIWLRHVGVILVIFVGAAIISLLTPSDVDPQFFFYSAVILSFLYLGIYYLLLGRRK
jgi:hypothetical protein